MLGAVSTHDNALQINMDAAKYGTLAEIGAGQEVSRVSATGEHRAEPGPELVLDDDRPPFPCRPRHLTPAAVLRLDGKPEEQLEPLVDGGELVARNAIENATDSTFVDGPEVVDERVRRS